MIDHHYIHSIKKDEIRNRIYNPTNLKEFNKDYKYAWDIEAENVFFIMIYIEMG